MGDPTAALSTTAAYQQNAGHDFGGTLTSPQTVSITGRTFRRNGDPLQAASTTRATVVTTGIITINGSYTQTSQGTLSVQAVGVVAGADYGQLLVSSGVALGGNLQMIADYVIQPGDDYAVLCETSTAAISQTFSGLPEGGVPVECAASLTASPTSGAPVTTPSSCSSSPSLSITDVSMPQATSGTLSTTSLFHSTVRR